jgi:ABC-type transport system involved in cytochrome c biogenesis permease subunit
VLLAAIVFGQLLTFEGQRGVVEGEPGFTDAAVSYWMYAPGRWFAEDDHAGWRLDLDAFAVDWVRDPLAPGAGQPTLFRSDVTVTPRDGERFAAVVEGNRPLTVDGRKIHQLDWGYAARMVVREDGRVVHDGFALTEDRTGFFAGAVKAPAAVPDVGVELFLYPFAPDGPDGPRLTGAPWDDAPLMLVTVWRGDLQLGLTQQFINELDVDALDLTGIGWLRPGETLAFGDGTVASRSSSSSCAAGSGSRCPTRPQLPWLLVAGAMLSLGLITALYAYRRRIWVVDRAGRHDPGTAPGTAVPSTGSSGARSSVPTSPRTSTPRSPRGSPRLEAEPVAGPAAGRSGRMTQTQLAELSKLLYSPVTLALYVAPRRAAARAHAERRRGPCVRRCARGAGALTRRVGLALAWAGVATHVAHEVVRGLAQQRFPLGNMFEVTSLMALVGVAGGLWYVRSRGREELAGFVMLGGTLVLGLALLMYAEPGPLMPILDTWWRHFHVSLLVGAWACSPPGSCSRRSTCSPTRRAARTPARPGWSGGRVLGSAWPDAADGPDAGATVARGGRGGTAVATRDAGGHARPHLGAPARLGTFVGTSLVSWVWAVSVEPTRAGVTRMLTVNLTMVAAALVARHFTPYLPATDVLDSIAHRLIAFAFVLWTVGTIAGAMWAEQSWGRFWGWDPKETGAFLTWIAYAGYLHARATRGVRGRAPHGSASARSSR